MRKRPRDIPSDPPRRGRPRKVRALEAPRSPAAAPLPSLSALAQQCEVTRETFTDYAAQVGRVGEIVRGLEALGVPAPLALRQRQELVALLRTTERQAQATLEDLMQELCVMVALLREQMQG